MDDRDRTPNKGTPQSSYTPPRFIPVKLPESPAAGSPNRNLAGLPRVVRDIVADLYNTIQRWNDSHIKGAAIVKQISSIKSDNPSDFSEGLEQLANDLYYLVQNLRQFKNALQLCSSQIVAAAQLHKEREPIFISLPVEKIVVLVNEIVEAYAAEFQVKEFVLENISFCENKDDAVFVAALWIYQYKILDSIAFQLETLLIETGHRRI